MSDLLETPAKRYYRLNKAKINARSTAWRKSNPDAYKAICRRNEAKRKQRRLLEKKLDRQNNPQKYRRIDKQIYARIRDKVLARLKQFNATPEGKLTTLLRNTCRRVAKLGNTKHPKKKDILGAPIEVVRAHIESQFLPGMTWENHGLRGWHIDHKRPLASFDLTQPDQLRAAGHYTNLAPMWAYDNWSKGAKTA